MERNYRLVAAAFTFMIAAVSCEVVDNDPDKHVKDDDSTYVGLEEVAEILALVPLQSFHLQEVHDAVISSSDNGYDEEYTMRNLFGNPGSGVGERHAKSSGLYENPLRDLIADWVRESFGTRSESCSVRDPEKFIDALTDSDIQIYWPFSENWDGEAMPVITYDPEDGSEKNIGYELSIDDDGFRHVEEVLVDEDVAMSRPVWVINRNSDACHTSLEMLRRGDPLWGEGGGNIIVRPSGPEKKLKSDSVKSLILKDFTMNRNYDSWFAGASEFFVKTGYIDDFTASTEAELRLYNPLVTDFMIVVKRSQVGIPQPFNAIIMSDWSDQMTSYAFMITEDDGGTRTDWTTKAKVFVAGKSYGIEVTIPLNSRDDVVWRGQLANRWLEQNSNVVGHFGDVDLTFEVLEY